MIRSTLKPSIKPAVSPKPRSGKCRVCHAQFTKSRSIQPTCEKFECKVAYAERVTAQAAARRVQDARRREAADIKVRKEAIKTRSDHMKAAQTAFNAFIRARDEGKPCICCGRTNDKYYLTGSAWDAGHYRSVGSAPHLRFDERNVHRQLVVCNRHGSGRAVDYRLGLIARIGLAEVEALEADQAPRHWTIPDLIAIRDLYKKKLRDFRSAEGAC